MALCVTLHHEALQTHDTKHTDLDKKLRLFHNKRSEGDLTPTSLLSVVLSRINNEGQDSAVMGGTDGGLCRRV